MGDDLHDAQVADLIAVAERAVNRVAPPVLGQSVNVGELVEQTSSGQDTACYHRVATDQLNTEVVVVDTGHLGGAAGDDFAPVATNLGTGDCGQLRGRHAFVAEVAVHVCGRGISGLPGIDHDDRSSLPTELQGRSKTSSRTADDRYVAVPLDAAWLIAVWLIAVWLVIAMWLIAVWLDAVWLVIAVWLVDTVWLVIAHAIECTGRFRSERHRKRGAPGPVQVR